MRTFNIPDRRFPVSLISLLMATIAGSAQLLPPDAVDLSKIKITEHLKSTDLCPVTNETPSSNEPIFEYSGIVYRASSAEAQAKFLESPEQYIEKARYQRWEQNFVRSMSPVWCPVTDQVNPGGFGEYEQQGLQWRTCCQFCNPALVPDCFSLAEKRLRERARTAYELTGAVYASEVSNPIEGALRAVEDFEGNLVIPKLVTTKIENGVIASLGSAPIEDDRFDRAYGEWRHYGGDRAHNRYSSLNQINGQTVDQLKVAWRWTSIDHALADANPKLRPGAFKPTPIMVGGVLYTSTCFSQVAAIDAGTGKTIWSYDPESYRKGRPANSGYQHRGVEYWTDGTKHRIFIATGGRQLISIDALTGRPDLDFGEEGIVDLTQGLGREFDERQLGYNSPVVVCRNTIVVGCVVYDYPNHPTTPPGHIRGFDAHTGERKWIFHTIPQEGEFGNETWEDDSWRVTGNVNVWSTMSADEELGYVYLPIGTPTNDYYGGHRLGNNLYADSLVCLNAETGDRVWHFQAVHHGLWDYDFCSGPNLVDINHNGKQVPVVAQISKQGFTYVFNRKTGEPIWPIEEREVPPSDVPGERVSPTQPFPTKPPAFERQTLFDDDLIDFTPEIRAETLQILAKFRRGPMFLPPSVPGAAGKAGTLILPSPSGGANWAGSAVNPATGTLFIPSETNPIQLNVKKTEGKESSFRYNVQYGGIRGPEGLPITKPPYSRITAIDLNKGEFAWQVPHGDGPRDHPAIKHLNTGPLGYVGGDAWSRGGGILAGGLFLVTQFRGQSYDKSKPVKKGGVLNAFDEETGEHVWQLDLEDFDPLGTPMTYLHQGKQHLIIAGRNGQRKGELIALSLGE